MRIAPELTDEAVLGELGRRLAERRIALRMSQAELAERAGIGKRTVERIEAGESSQLTSWIRLLRAVDLLAALDALIPADSIRPLALLEQRGKRLQRVRKRDAGRDQSGRNQSDKGEWTWSEPE